MKQTLTPETMNIKQGGTTENLRENIKTLTISKEKNRGELFDLWINEDSLSYLTIDEVMDLKHEIDDALKIYIES